MVSARERSRVAVWGVGIYAVCLGLVIGFTDGWAIEGDRATHQTDHDEDVLELPEVHVHGVPINKDRQKGPVATFTPWPGIPPSLDGKPLDDWMKARLLVSKTAEVTVVILEPCKHRELTQAGLAALGRWKFDPQLSIDDPIDGELTVRIHFRAE
jgi:hypothetical protein